MIAITDTIALDERELCYHFVRASGPGGQNVNKVSSAVELRLDVRQSSSLPEDLKNRLARIAGHRLSNEGVLLIDAHRFRTQAMNRKDALHRLIALLQEAAIPPTPRKATQPSRAVRAARRQAQAQPVEAGAARTR